MPPYNTRRKSLSLAELGIALPKRSRALEQHPSPPETVVEGEEPPVKRAKRVHGSQSPPLSLMSPPRSTAVRIKEEDRKQVATLSPPPSPATESHNKVDTEGINDDIVIATIRQLEKTGNRPHLVKELAAALANNLYTAEECAPLHTDVASKITKSANPCALISSRLTAYLNRPWPSISPCPLAKDLSSAHPRRLYFFLTTTPHQPIPTVVDVIPKASHIISPSISSASADGEDPRFARGRHAISPSPEVDLSSPELDNNTNDNADMPPTPCGSFSERNSLPRERTSFIQASRRPTSPQLEYEERDFKQTASQLYEQAQAARRSSQSMDVNMADNVDATPGALDPEVSSIHMSIEAADDESEESAARKDSEAAVALFGPVDHLRFSSSSSDAPMDFSSPVIQPQTGGLSPTPKYRRHDELMEGVALGSNDKNSLPSSAFPWDEDHLLDPENIELDELDNMFDSY